MLVVLFIASFLILHRIGRSTSRKQALRSSTACVLFLSLGGASTSVKQHKTIPEEEIETCLVIESFRQSTSSWRAQARCVWDSEPIRLQLIHFRNIDEALTPGDSLWVRGVISPFPGPAYPHAFDPRAFYLSKDVLAQLKVDSFNAVYRAPIRLRATLQAWFQDELIQDDHEEGALLYAMVTGDKQLLSSSIKENFSKSGTMHLLAVSGLHIGLIAALPLYFLKRARKKSVRIIWITITLIITSVFCWFTGTSPSALRATGMVVILCAALGLRKKGNSLNTLATVGLFMIAAQPSVIFKLGFQLSFAAVAGIVLWQTHFRSFFLRCRLPRKVASALGTSVAAQLSTSGLSIFYFRMFPVYFLIANFIMVPLATVTMYVLLLSLSMKALGIPSSWIDQLMYWLSTCMINVSAFIADLPGAVINGIQSSGLEIVLATFFAILIFTIKRRWILKGALMASVLFLYLIRQDPRPQVLFFGGAAKGDIALTINDHSYYLQTKWGKETWATRDWRELNDADWIDLRKDTLVKSNGCLFHRADGVCSVNGLFVAIGNKKIASSLIISGDTITYEQTRWSLYDGPLLLRLNSNRSIGERFYQHRPPIP
ncbi:ComEC/Rec2 family competence protein [Sanyastnella coralliicola]|uniref:ComEC/Rec2 family competence protein n=1 Tax=Sanyastnella coralliicola TaxID=3069118 RepID=UPI0027BA63BC|nr:ComEC/Rec2 family competence protein [Longitalea sp. SCSIO 12813]